MTYSPTAHATQAVSVLVSNYVLKALASEFSQPFDGRHHLRDRSSVAVHQHLSAKQLGEISAQDNSTSRRFSQSRVCIAGFEMLDVSLNPVCIQLGRHGSNS